MSDPFVHFLTSAVAGTAAKSAMEYSTSCLLGQKSQSTCLSKTVDFVIFGLFGMGIDIDHVPYYLGIDLGWFQRLILSLGPFNGRLLHPVVPVVVLTLLIAAYGIFAVLLLDTAFLPQRQRVVQLKQISIVSGNLAFLPGFLFASLTHLFFDYGVACIITKLTCDTKYLPDLSRILFP